MADIIGTEAGERLVGTVGNDTIAGLGGADSIDGAAGDDGLSGGSGNDAVYGGLGTDTIDGGDDNDALFGEQGNDILTGGAGADELYDGAGDDSLSGGIGDDTLVSHGYYNQQGDFISSDGTDLLDGGDGDDTIRLARNSGANDIVTARGGAGSDVFIVHFAFGGRYGLDGGPGADLFLINDHGGTYTIDAGDDVDHVNIGRVGGAATISLGGGADLLTIGYEQMHLIGRPIVVTDFASGAGGDALNYDSFLDAALIGWDPSTNPFASGHLRLVQSGADTLLRVDRDGSGGAYGFVTLVTFRNEDAAGFTAANLDGYAPDGSPPAGMLLIGTEGHDSLTGGAGADLIQGLGGYDMLAGGAGNDGLIGGAGNDNVYGGVGRDAIDGGDHNDTLSGEGGDDTILGGLGDDTIYDGTGNDLIEGGTGNDMIISYFHYSQEGAYLHSSGDDTLRGGEGNDWIRIARDWGRNDAITADGGAGDDFINVYFVSGGSMDLIGGAGRDKITIADGGATYRVDAGEDADEVLIEKVERSATIALGGGSDVLTLGVEQAARIAQATIVVTDFAAGAGGDRVNFDSFLTQALHGWNQDLNPFGTGHLFLVQSGADTLLRIDRDGSGTAHGQITLITFRQVGASAFTADNLDGYAPDGSAPAGLSIVGTAGDDRLVGTVGGDVVQGLGGRDSIDGAGGDDELSGGAGNDTLYGGLGADAIGGGDDDDSINGEGGHDTLQGGGGADTITDGAGNDLLDGGAGDDMLISYFHVSQTGDHLYSTGNDVLLGGEGNDWLRIARDAVPDLVTADGGAGNDLINVYYAFAGTYALTGGIGADTITVYDSGGGYTIDAGDDADHVNLEKIMGSARVTLGGGADTLTIGRETQIGVGTITVTDFTGADRVNFDMFLATVLIGWDQSANPFLTGHLKLVQSGSNIVLTIDLDGAGRGYNHRTLATFENSGLAAFTAGNLDGYTPTLGGTDGDDSLLGTVRAEALDGGAGADTMAGGADDDVYFVDHVGDSIVENEGEGSDEVRTALGSRSDHAQLYVLSANVENLAGTSAEGQGVRGNALDNRIAMGAGNDLVVLDDGGDDTAAGGAGNDFFFYGAALTAADRTDGGAGIDTVALLGDYDLAFAAGSLAGVERLALYTGLAAGGAGEAHGYTLRTIDANVAAGQELLVTAASLRAGEILVFDGSAETDGRFAIVSGAGDDILAGGGRHDYLAGGGGDDRLFGMGSNDTLYGGAGADSLRGGGGADTFRYEDARQSTAAAADRIVDFGFGGADRIDLSAIDPDSATAGDQSFAFIGTGTAFSGAAGELRVVETGGTWFVEADVNGDAIADLAIRIDNGASYTFAASDFVL